MQHGLHVVTFLLLNQREPALANTQLSFFVDSSSEIVCDVNAGQIHSDGAGTASPGGGPLDKEDQGAEPQPTYALGPRAPRIAQVYREQEAITCAGSRPDC